MQRFNSIEKLDTWILYTLELVASLSVLFLATGLIISVANVLTNGGVLTNNEFGKQFYAWSQAIGIDAAIPGVMLRLFSFYKGREFVKAGVYTVLAMLVLFTAFSVSNIEALQQTLNISLDTAYTHIPFISVEMLIWIRSLTVILIIVCHAIKSINPLQSEQPVNPIKPKIVNIEPTTVKEVDTPESVQPVQKKRTLRALPTPKGDFYEPISKYLSEYPRASLREIGKAVGCSATTAKTWRDVIQQKQA